MYLRVQYPKIQCLTNDGKLASGYEIHTFDAGLSTRATTYSDRLLSVANLNPVVLNSRGEADIYTGKAIKLVFTIPGGDPNSPIWVVDYVGEQESNDLSGAATSDAYNNYTVTVTPAPTSLTDRLELIMTPDKDSKATLVVPVGSSSSTVFTGTGINDGTFSGPYVGSTAGSVFTVEIDSAVQPAPVAPMLANNSTAGAVTIGNHSVKLVGLTATGHTDPSSASSTVSALGGEQLDVSGIPTVSGEITGYDLYMNTASGTTWYKVNGSPIVSTTYTINISDATLVANDVAPTDNTTASNGSADTFRWKKDGGAWTSGVAITAAKQLLIDGISIIFAELTGHTYGDISAVTVMTPARLNLNSLGNKIIYKNVDGSLVALGAGDLKQDIAALLIYNLSSDCWNLINPSTATMESLAGQITTNRPRIEVTSDRTQIISDAGCELSFNGTLTYTLMDASSFVNKFVDLKNIGTGIVTIDAGSYIIKGTGASTYQLNPGQGGRIITNGVDWHIVMDTGHPPIGTILAYGGSLVAPFSYLWCDGAAYSRTTYAQLYSVIGTAFGSGDGSSTFNVPDLRQRFPIGQSTSGTGSTLGATGGDIDHTHSLNTDMGSPADILAVGTDPSNVVSLYSIYNTTGYIPSTDSNNPPFQVVNYIIRY